MFKAIFLNWASYLHKNIFEIWCSFAKLDELYFVYLLYQLPLSYASWWNVCEKQLTHPFYYANWSRNDFWHFRSISIRKYVDALFRSLCSIILSLEPTFYLIGFMLKSFNKLHSHTFYYGYFSRSHLWHFRSITTEKHFDGIL